MTADIGAATTFVHVEFYIVSFDATTKKFFAAIEAAVTRGVTVRLLPDHIASRPPQPSQARRRRRQGRPGT